MGGKLESRIWGVNLKVGYGGWGGKEPKTSFAISIQHFTGKKERLLWL